MPLRPLLFLSPRVPWPLVTGARIRTAALLGALRQAFDVHYAGFCDGPMNADCGLRNAELAEFKLVHLSPERATTRAGQAWLGLRTLAGPRPVTLAKYWDRALAEAAGRWVAEHPDGILHADHLHMASYLNSQLTTHNPQPKVLRVIDEHNVESMILERLARETASPLKRAYLNLQARRLRAAEAGLVARADLTLAVSRADADELARLAPGARIEVIPNGVDLEYFRPAPDRAPRPGRMIFTGSMNWVPNEDAMVWFAKEIYPQLTTHNSQSWSLDIVGHAPTAAVRALAAPGVRVTGTVPDVRPYMDEAEIYVVPLRVGGGSRLKILEAWAMGVPVVSTAIGCEGLEAADGEQLLLADTPREFAAAIARLAGDPALRAALAARARAHVEARFGWNAIGRRLVEIYQAHIS